ncbi:M48 family metallopeptidase, partial [Candidatus Dependentiae bacterium]|nr:M48 family metallopeptidase [Candidatus Dependentiae bacterium]
MTFKQFFISIFFIKSIVHLCLNAININYLKKKSGIIPPEIEGSVNQEISTKSTEYNLEKMKFNFLTDLIDITLTSFFLFTPLFGYYTDYIDLIKTNHIVKGLIFFNILTIVNFIFNLPFSYYSNFFIESKYGFNKYNIKTWMIDNIKSIIMQSLIISVLLILILYMAGESVNVFKWSWVFTGWAVISFVLILFTFLVPVIILPFFYKLKPLKSIQLTEKIDELLLKLNFKIKGIYSVDASIRSTHANAGFAGFGKSKKIIIFDTILDGKYSDEEIMAVLAHEIGHAKKKHIQIQMILSIITLFFFITFILYLLSYDSAYSSMGIKKNFYAGILFAGFFFESVFYFIQPLANLISQKFEYDADSYSKKSLGTSFPLISSFKKFVVNDYANINPHPLYEKFYYSHPS